MERRAEHRVTGTKKRSGTKARDIQKLYPKEKAESLIKKLKEKGMWHYDEDFEGDEEEIFYYVGAGNEMKDENITSESACVGVKVKGDKELAESLTGEGCALAAGAVPSLATGSEAGTKHLLEAVTTAATTESKTKRRKGNAEPATPAVPKTILEWLGLGFRSSFVPHCPRGLVFTMISTIFESQQSDRFSVK